VDQVLDFSTGNKSKTPRGCLFGFSAERGVD